MRGDDQKNKAEFLKRFMAEHDLKRAEVGYIGDDLNDLEAMRLAGYVGCPLDSCPEVLEFADYVSAKRGGEGAVRDVIEDLLRKSGEWQYAVEHMYRQENG